jgi:L-alanine exporter
MKLKRFVVDMVALNLFVFASGFIVEMVLSGISWSVFWRGRLIMIIPNIITVEPYNSTRTWIGMKLGVWKYPQLHQVVRDTLVFILYRVPLVFIVLSFLGAPMSKVISSCVAATIVSGFTGRPYGIFLDWMRKTFKV